MLKLDTLIHLGNTENHHPGKIVSAIIHEETDRNHVLSINNERFGVYRGYCRKIGASK